MGFAILAALLAAAAPAPDGRKVFQRCYSCHSVDPSETDLPGPNLAGIVGRPAGRQAGFKYSRAMRRAAARGLVWDEATLDRYLANPQGVVPLTEMDMPPLRRAADRQAVIAYLKAHGAAR